MATTGLPSDVTVSRGPVEDFDEFHDFVRSVNIDQSDRAIVSREVLEAVLSMPDVDQTEDIRIVRDGSGALVGAGWVQSRNPFVETFTRGLVSPDRLGEGIGSFLLDWELAAANERISSAPEDAQVVAKTFLDPGHAPSVALFADRGFSVTRYFLEMRIDFADGSFPDVPLADGLRLVGFDPESDHERLFDVIDEAFRDHYGHVERPHEEELARFMQFMSIPTFEPSLVWMVMDGDEVVAGNICVGNHEGDTNIGYVASLGVLRPWRGKGIAKSMLVACFSEFARRGKTATALHVDAASPTGATHLYESVGMRETHRDALYELELRPGEDLSVR